MNRDAEKQTNTRNTLLKLSMVCLLCISLISGLAYLIQFFTQ